MLRLGCEYYLDPGIDYLLVHHRALEARHGPNYFEILGEPTSLWPAAEGKGGLDNGQ